MVIFFEFKEISCRMQTYQSPCGSPCGAFQIRSRLDDDDFPGGEVAKEAASAVGLFSSPPKKQKLEIGSAPISGPPPEEPRKPTKKRNSHIQGLPVLPEGFNLDILETLGKGSFGKVFRVNLPGSPDSPYAMKVIKLDGRISPSDLRCEASNYGSPKCIDGVGMSSFNGRKYFGFSPIAEPLDKASITPENVEDIDKKIRAAVMGANFSLITDTSPENMGIVRAGTPTPILGEDGLLCAGSPVEKDEVVVIDVGSIPHPNDCNGKYGALFDEEAMDSDEAKLKYRQFKCDMMSALLRNRLLAEPRNEFDIVREICKSPLYGYTYAAGDRR